MAILVVVVCLFGTLMGRLWYLQGVEAATPVASQLASEGEETFYIPAQRGDIFDRNGVLLAGNRITQVVTVNPGAVDAHPGIVAELGALLGEPVATVQAAVDNNQYSPYQPVPVAEGVSQAVVLAIDARRHTAGVWHVYTRGGRDDEGLDAVRWAARGEELGAGEILLTSMDTDGVQDGFDCALTAAVSRATNVPVIASGGAGKPEHFVRVLTDGCADAALAASIFHYGTYTVNQLKEELDRRGIPVRVTQ